MGFLLTTFAIIVTAGTTQGNMSMISMQGRVIYSMFKQKMKKLENNLRNSPEKQLWRRLNFKSIQQELNFMN
jgi:hypothetical protein